MTAEAEKARKQKLAALRRVVRLCTCEWPLTRYRNGDGHDPACPAHTPLFDSSQTKPGRTQR